MKDVLGILEHLGYRELRTEESAPGAGEWAPLSDMNGRYGTTDSTDIISQKRRPSSASWTGIPGSSWRQRGSPARSNKRKPMPELPVEAIDAAALFVVVLCWGTALFPAAGFWGLYNQRARS